MKSLMSGCGSCNNWWRFLCTGVFLWPSKCAVGCGPIVPSASGSMFLRVLVTNVLVFFLFLNMCRGV